VRVRLDSADRRRAGRVLGRLALRRGPRQRAERRSPGSARSPSSAAATSTCWPTRCCSWSTRHAASRAPRPRRLL
jgi:hypothetical protein